MQTAAIYIRVSTDDQVEYSPDAQLRMAREYAKKNNMIIPKEYIFQDDGISGKKSKNRPAFQQMLAMAKSEEHPFDVILVWKFSRFARNQEESIVYKNLLKKSNVEVISVSEPIPDGFIGELVQRIFEWMDEYYSINLSGEVLRGMTQRAMTGKYNSSPPLGYKMQNGIPEIVPEQAEIVKLIFELYVNRQMGFYDIARHLNSLGYKTKRGGTFQNRTVAYIIRNEFYIGKIIWNRINHETRIEKDSSEWIVREGDYETFISKELFEAAQERDRHTKRPKKARPTSTYKHWLSGIIVCSNCGQRLVKSSYVTKSGVTSFQCTGYNHGSCLVSHSVTDSKLEPAILTALENILNSSDVEYTVVRSDVRCNNDNAIIKKKLQDLQLKELRIKEAYMDGIDSLEEYKSNKQLLAKEREYLQSQLTEEKSSDCKKQLLDNIKSAYDIISNETDPIRKHEALASICEKIVYNKPSESLELQLYVTL